MVKEFNKNLINLIIIVSLLLALCVAVDYAAITIEGNSSIQNVSVNSTDKVLLVDENDSMIVPGPDDKVYTDKNVKVKKEDKVPTVTITSKPSCGCGYGYYWHTMTFRDYCPHCHRYGVLRNVHKWPARYEQELTCTCCGADYCGCCGKEKYSWSRVYLRRA